MSNNLRFDYFLGNSDEARRLLLLLKDILCNFMLGGHCN